MGTSVFTSKRSSAEITGDSYRVDKDDITTHVTLDLSTPRLHFDVVEPQSENSAVLPVVLPADQSLTVAELVAFARPLDLLLFRGTDAVSKTISCIEKKRLGNGDYTHVGIVVTHALWPHPNMRPGELYVWESTMSMACCGLTDGVPDIEHNKGRFGVQVRRLSDVVAKYSGSVAWAPLLHNPWAEADRVDSVREKFRSIQTQYGDATYDASFLELFSAILPPLRCLRNAARCFRTCGGRRSENEWVFCSEGVAIVYQAMGLIEDKFTPRDVVPVDFLGVDEDGLPRLVGSIRSLT